MNECPFCEGKGVYETISRGLFSCEFCHGTGAVITEEILGAIVEVKGNSKLDEHEEGIDNANP